MATKPERINLSWTPIGNIFVSSTDPSTAYVRADVVQMLLDEQREVCAKDAEQAAIDYSRHGLCHIKVYEACLNATGESDDK